MTRTRALLLFSILLLATALPSSARKKTAAGGQAQAIAKADKAARSWLPLVDARKYSQSWDAASSVFQAGVTKEQWTQEVQSVRDQTGTIKSRSRSHAEYTTSLPNAPAGQYVILQYKSAFAKMPSCVETVVMMDDGGHWKTAGYFVKPT